MPTETTEYYPKLHAQLREKWAKTDHAKAMAIEARKRKTIREMRENQRRPIIEAIDRRCHTFNADKAYREVTSSSA